jgi:ABC-type bacteriocin/lantibiotic exporter with double-glycine peptidase domain
MYLFDDSLSAVDAIVGARIAQNCFSDQGILKDSTRVLVTHQSQFVNLAEHVVVLDGGKIIFQGSRKQFQDSKCIHRISTHGPRRLGGIALL